MTFFRRPKPDPEPTPEPSENEVQVFLDEARRLLDYHWRRGDAFERKSLGVLGFTSVVVALISSAVSAAGALRARDSKSVNIDDVRSSWRKYLDRKEQGGGYSDAWHTAGAKRDLVEMLLHGTTDTQSPVESLRQDADRRGRWFVWAIGLNLLSLVLILALTVTTTWGTLS